MGLDLTLVKVQKDKGFVRTDELLDGELSPSSTINRKFICEVEMETIFDNPQMPAEYYSRPLDFDQAIEWVKSNIDNSTEPIHTLFKMREDPTLYLKHL